ncbi:MAG: hypothetical protein HGB17_00150 [Syntrophobacteraceae bacterium]|nr:hypothetical protein [Syntrophobacteraceae bacterium]
MSATEQQATQQEQQQTIPQQVENQPQGNPQQQQPVSPKYIITHSDLPTNPEPSQDGTPREAEKKADDQAGQNQEAAKNDGGADGKAGEKDPRWYVKKIDRMHKKYKQLEEKLGAQKNTEAEEPSTNEGKPPDLVDFESYDDYLKAQDAWRNRDSDALQGAIGEIVESYDAVRPKYADFNEIVNQDDLHITKGMVKLIADVEDVEPGEVVYYLGKHKGEALAISKLDEGDQIKAIAKIEAKLSLRPIKPESKTTNAPPPISPVNGAGSSAQRKLSDAKTHTEYREIKREIEAQNPGRSGWL